MMKQNKYDEVSFFAAYEKMPRSIKGLEGAGEWSLLKAMLPELNQKRVLDLGCGFGWRCLYAREQQASSVIGVDLSEKMLQRARANTNDSLITYLQKPIEDINFADASFDVVISSLALHYVESFHTICQKVYACLESDGTFVLSVEHPIFTARHEQDWFYNEEGNRLHWPIDYYQSEGIRKTTFLTENVVKYHRTVATYINELIHAGFTIKGVEESRVSPEMNKNDPNMLDENRRPMFLLIAAEKGLPS